MSKYSKALKDSVYEELKDEKIKMVSGELETAILDTLVPKANWPKHWNSPDFSPCHNVADAFSLLETVYPGEKWNLKCCEAGIYECWVKDEDRSIFTFTAERAITLAIWNAHNFDIMEEGKDVS